MRNFFCATQMLRRER